MKKLLIGMATLLLMLCVLTGCGNGSQKEQSVQGASSVAASKEQAGLTVKVLNVGQGDAVLIQTATQTILVDTSDVDERDKLQKELKKAGVTVIDKVILTHPHADHIGGMDVVLKNFDVKEVYDNGMASTSPIYKGYMKSMKEKNIKRHTLKAGDTLDFGNGVEFKVLHPTAELVKKGQEKGYKHDPNNESVVGKLIFKDFSMLLTGDAAKDAEEREIKSYSKELKSKIIKVPHHGSKGSSGKKFLDLVTPEVGIVSCGTGNDYGHPHKEAVKRYEDLKCKLYRTDLNGTVTIRSDGSGYDIEVEQP